MPAVAGADSNSPQPAESTSSDLALVADAAEAPAKVTLANPQVGTSSNNEGSEISAAALGMDDSTVTLRRADVRVFEHPLDQLSDASRQRLGVLKTIAEGAGASNSAGARAPGNVICMTLIIESRTFPLLMARLKSARQDVDM